jgi:hypothetical protein
MYRVHSVIVADNVLRDADSNRISVIGILDQLRPGGFPILMPRLSAIAICSRETNDSPTPASRARVILGEQTLFEDGVEINFREGRLHRSILRFEGFVIPGVGDLIFEWDVAGAVGRSHPIAVSPPPQAPVVAPVNAG